MTSLDVLPHATNEFDRRVRLVAPDQWTQPSGLGEWTVRDLVDHVVGGNRMATVLLAGGTRDEAKAAFGLSREDTDLPAAFAESARAQADAFAAAGDMTAIVHHPMGDMPASQLLDFRLTDLVVHAWDLAQATGGDEALDAEAVAAVWELLQPFAPFIGQVGVFGEGPSGSVPDDAPLQERMLDFTGRRP